jgi:hypothetical protein
MKEKRRTGRRMKETNRMRKEIPWSSSHFMKPNISLPHSQELLTIPYSEPVESSEKSHTQLL